MKTCRWHRTWYLKKFQQFLKMFQSKVYKKFQIDHIAMLMTHPVFKQRKNRLIS